VASPSALPGRFGARGPLVTGRRAPDSSALLIGAGALALAALVSALIAYHLKYGLAALALFCLVPIVLLRLRLAICAWLLLVFFDRLPGLESVPNRLLLVIAACWIIILLDRRADVAPMYANWSVRAMGILTVLFLAWLALTMAWAPEVSTAWRELRTLLYCGLILVMILGTITEPKHVRWLMWAFVVGAVLSVMLGIAQGNLQSSELTSAAAVEAERFAGGAGDPNYLAAVLAPAIVLAVGLAMRASVPQRFVLIVSIAFIAAGLVATRSRGGLIALGVACIVALVIWRGRRALMAAIVGLCVAAMGVAFVASPESYRRIFHTADSGSGSGRLDIWHVAWQVTISHPVFGVGLAQFPAVSPHYVNLPGPLLYVSLLVAKHIVVHNLFLQLWAETGIVGLLLFLTIVVISIASAFRAVSWFDEMHDEEMAALSRAAIAAMAATLAASFFLSNINDRRIWVLLALGPLLAGIAARRRQAAAGPSAHAVLE
jgi:O-antigen ligase